MAFKAKYRGTSVDGDPIEPGDTIEKAGSGYRLVGASERTAWNTDPDRSPRYSDEPSGWWGPGEYPPADMVYDARGGATSDYEWYGDDS